LNRKKEGQDQMRHTRSDASRSFGWIARRAVPMHAAFILIMALAAGQLCFANDAVNIHAVFLQADGNCRVDNNKKLISCDRVAQSFRADHMKSDSWISLFIDNAKYETVVKMLDLFRQAEFTNVDVSPPIMGTNLSSDVTRWIRIRVEGLPNHPFAMLLITTEQFKTWREEVLVLSPTRYETIDRFIQTRMLQPDCEDIRHFRPEPPYSNRIALTERNADRSHACVIPPGESCNSLSQLLDLPDVNWTDTDRQPIKHVWAELNCKSYPSQGF
jgi:hypothetical protein